MRIQFKYTSRSRPKEFLRGLNSIIDNVASDDYEVLVSLDLDDPKLDNYGNCDAFIGSSTGKIDAGTASSSEMLVGESPSRR